MFSFPKATTIKPSWKLISNETGARALTAQDGQPHGSPDSTLDRYLNPRYNSCFTNEPSVPSQLLDLTHGGKALSGVWLIGSSELTP